MSISKRPLSLSTCALVVLAALAPSPCAQAAPAAPPPNLIKPGALGERGARAKAALVAGGNAFALDLYRNLGRAEGNLFFSPLSISTALTMTYAGAAAQTATQMRKALHLRLPSARVHAAFHALNQEISPSPERAGFELTLANKIFVQQRYQLRPAFRGVLRSYYAADAQNVDFSRREAAAARINGWVAKQTKGRIKQLVPPTAIDALTRLVLANAIYFKGTWRLEFKERATRPRDFFLRPEQRVKVDTMFQQAKLRYGEKGAVQVLELPYRGDQLAMVVLLPRSPDGLAQLEGALTPSRLRAYLSRLRERKVKVYLPRFKLKWGKTLKETLISLGMKEAFSQARANFKPMSPAAPTQGLYISDVFHKAFVEVNEKGTEAAAATAVLMGTRGRASHKPSVPVFRADHPFVFFIRHKRSGALLFAGRLADPR